MSSALDRMPRSYVIKRSQHLGYGFVAGYESPTMVKSVEPNGPSFKRLLPGDVIMAVNGIDVRDYSLEQIIKTIQLCVDQIEIKVRQPTYEELIRAKNLSNPNFYKSNTLSSTNHYSNRQAPSLPLNMSPLNRLVTPISQQQQQPASNSPFACRNIETPPVQIKPTSDIVLKQKQINGTEVDKNNNRVLGRSQTSYGRHSPLPQRCKSSLDTQNGISGKKSGRADNDQPLLKRSNTMRPVRPPAQVLELYKIVIKIFFEDGHYRTLTYNQDTTIATILETLNSRHDNSPNAEQIKRYFGIAVTTGDNPEDRLKKQLLEKKPLLILEDNNYIMKLRQLPYAPKLRLLYRMVYPPSDISGLYAQDKHAFEYLYQQSCNDLKLERFCPELDQETALKLSALRLLEYVHSHHSKAHGNSKNPKVYIKLIKKNPGIEHFLPSSMVENIIDKKGRRIVGQYKKMKTKLTDYLKRNFEEFDFEPPKVKSTTNLDRYTSTSFHELSIPGMQSTSSDYIKLLFLNYLSQLPCYGNSKRPRTCARTSTSPVERNNAVDCSSSLESVPRTSDSSPLIRQDRVANSQNNGRIENVNTISRLAQMNSMRSMSSIRSSSISQPVDQPDMAQTPSMESISSITFNIQNSPSPQQTPSFLSHTDDNYPVMTETPLNLEPYPMPRQQAITKSQDYHSIEKLYSRRYMFDQKPIDELLKSVMILPPPPPTSMINGDKPYYTAGRKFDLQPTSQLTQVLSDTDIEKLRVPPPPRIFN